MEMSQGDSLFSYLKQIKFMAVLISTSKNPMSFLLFLISTLQWNWRKAQNRFCLEARGVGREGGAWSKREK
jgi:hypothetical protein